MTMHNVFKEAVQLRIREGMRRLSIELHEFADRDKPPSYREKFLSEVTKDEATANLTRLVSEYPGRPVVLSEEALKLVIGGQ